MIFTKNCPECATAGQIWKRRPLVHICPNCSTVFSEFGVLLEGKEHILEAS